MKRIFKRNKKGFTMVELLAVIVILAIIMLIAVPVVTSYIRNSESKYYESTADLIKTAGREFFSDNKALRPKEIGNIDMVDVSDLVTNKYISQPKSTNDENCEGKVVIKKNSDGEYEYYLCMSCGDYTLTEDALMCDANASNSNFTIEAPSDYTIVQNSVFTPKTAKVYNNGELIKDDLLPTPATIDTYKLGVNQLKYNYKGTTKIVNVTVIDVTKPVAPAVIAREVASDGSEIAYDGNWTNNNIKLYFSSSDGSGSGISYFLYGKSSSGPWTKVTGGSLTITTASASTSGDTYYIKAVDASGNESVVSSINVKIDKTDITGYSYKVTGTAGSNGWYKSNLTLSIVNGTCGNSKCTATISPSSITSDTTGTTITVTVTNGAGVVRKFTGSVKMDKTAPTISAGSVTRSGYTVNASYTATDTISGVASKQYSYNTSDAAGTFGTSTTYSASCGQTIYVYARATNNAGVTSAATKIGQVSMPACCTVASGSCSSAGATNTCNGVTKTCKVASTSYSLGSWSGYSAGSSNGCHIWTLTCGGSGGWRNGDVAKTGGGDPGGCSGVSNAVVVGGSYLYNYGSNSNVTTQSHTCSGVTTSYTYTWQ